MRSVEIVNYSVTIYHPKILPHPIDTNIIVRQRKKRTTDICGFHRIHKHSLLAQQSVIIFIRFFGRSLSQKLGVFSSTLPISISVELASHSFRIIYPSLYGTCDHWFRDKIPAKPSPTGRITQLNARSVVSEIDRQRNVPTLHFIERDFYLRQSGTIVYRINNVLLQCRSGRSIYLQVLKQ